MFLNFRLKFNLCLLYGFHRFIICIVFYMAFIVYYMVLFYIYNFGLLYSFYPFLYGLLFFISFL